MAGICNETEIFIPLGLPSSERPNHYGRMNQATAIIADQPGHRVLSELENAQVTLVREQGAQLVATCTSLGSSPQLSLAKTKIAEAVIAIVTHIMASTDRA